MLTSVYAAVSLISALCLGPVSLRNVTLRLNIRHDAVQGSHGASHYYTKWREVAWSLQKSLYLNVRCSEVEWKDRQPIQDQTSVYASHCCCISVLTTVLQLALWHFPYISYPCFWESRILSVFPSRTRSGPLSIPPSTSQAPSLEEHTVKGQEERGKREVDEKKKIF